MSHCQIVGCDNPDTSRGWCIKHYSRWYRHGDPETNLRDPTPLVCDCPNPFPTPTDQCGRCCRVIADLVHARRRGTR